MLTTYTWARNIGNIDHGNTGQVGDNSLYMNYYNRKLDKGPNAIDIVHRFTLNSVWDLPFGSGRQYVQNGPLSHIIGGWTVSVISMMQERRAVRHSRTERKD